MFHDLQDSEVEGLTYPLVKSRDQLVYNSPPARSLHVTAGKEVIMSCGALDSPYILKLSGIRLRSELSKCSMPAVDPCEGIGQILSDHSSLT